MWNVVVWKIAAWKSEKIYHIEKYHFLDTQRLILSVGKCTICDSYRSRQIFIPNKNAWGRYCQPKAVEMRHTIKIYHSASADHTLSSSVHRFGSLAQTMSNSKFIDITESMWDLTHFMNEHITHKLCKSHFQYF